MSTALWVLGSYLLGSVPTSFLAAKYGAGIDLRQHGSGNLGATNLYRVLGMKYALPVGLIDIAKGAIPVWLIQSLEHPVVWVAIGVGVAAIIGHVFSVWMKLRGGKGVATAAGVVLALTPVPFLVTAVIWGAILKLTGFMSLASVVGAISFPLSVWILAPEHLEILGVGIALALFIIYTHRANIRRLMQGTELKVGRNHLGPS